MKEDLDLLTDFSAGEFFKASDFAPGERKTLTITGIESRVIREGERPKAILSFEEDARTLPLNDGNRKELAARFGRGASASIGKQVTLLTRPTNGPNGPCQGIRFADQPTSARIGDALPENMTAAPKTKKKRFA